MKRNSAIVPAIGVALMLVTFGGCTAAIIATTPADTAPTTTTTTTTAPTTTTTTTTTVAPTTTTAPATLHVERVAPVEVDECDAAGGRWYIDGVFPGRATIDTPPRIAGMVCYALLPATSGSGSGSATGNATTPDRDMPSVYCRLNGCGIDWVPGL